MKNKMIVAGIVIVFFLLAGLGYIIFSSFSGVPVLNYHQINDEAHNALTLSSYEFDAQMAYLYKAGYTTISPDQLLDNLQYGKPLPQNPILITFDDGYEDNYQVAYPILQKYHFTATIFLITDFVGRNGRYVSWRQVREMQDNGFSFQSHTLSHILLAKASDEEVTSQLTGSKEALEWRLGKKADYLAYPGGVYDQRVINLTKQAGYRAAFTINLGRNTKECGLFTLNRIPIFEASHTLLRFWLRLKFTETFSALQNFKSYLRKNGVSSLANLIYVP
ncbi:MAG: polysaccharide deacetylase family protein [Veillonellales bacterium]